MLLIEIPRIPPEGLDLDETLDPAGVHLEGDDELVLEGGRLDCRLEIVDGTTRLGGHLPVNVSGGLLRKGHPIGASGAAQIVELTEQLQGRGHDRQVSGARIALAHNGGGMIGTDAAATVVSILSKEV